MKKIMRIILVALSFLFLFSSFSCAKEPIYIGLSAPMTGQDAAYGNNFKRAIDLAMDQINQEGGIDGHPVKLIVEDSQGSPKIAKKIARKFTADKRIVAEIGDFTSSSSMAAAKLYQRAGMVQFSPSASHPSFAPGSPFSFSIAGTQEGMGPSCAKKAVNVLHKNKLAVLYTNNGWGGVAQKFFVEEAERLGVEIRAVESYLEGTTDFIPVLKRLREKKPDLLYICTKYKDGAMIARQRQELGWNDVDIMGRTALYSPKFIDLAGEAAESIFTETVFFPNNPRSEVQKFTTMYTKRYNSVPDVFAAYAFDAMNLLAQAMRHGGTSRSAIRDQLIKIKDYQGVTGKITFTQHGDIEREYILLQVKNGEFILYPEK